MITYRKATAADCPEMAALLTQAFDGYPIYALADGHTRNGHTAREMLATMNVILCNFFMRYGKDCFIADDNGIMAGLIMPEAPASPRMSAVRYSLCGGLELFKYMTPGTLKQYASVLIAPDADRKLRGEKDMYILNIAVRDLWRSQGLGRALIDECAVPYARDKGCTRITLNTCTAEGVKMYEHMGFEKVDEVKYECFGKSIVYYAMAKEIVVSR